jgi:uncharacterized protein (TIGR03437 family)
MWSVLGSGIPSITSISPTSGPVGTLVTITGSNLGSTQGSSTVTFGTTAATVSSWSDTQIQATVPSLSAGTYDVVVTTNAGSSNLVSFQIISSGPSITVSSTFNRVWANRHEKTEITVTVLNAQGQGVAGRNIRLSANPPAGVTISPPSGSATTDTSGKAYFTATSIKIGPVVFTATDVGNSALVASAQVEFIQRRVVVFAQGINTELNIDTAGNIFPAIRDRLTSLGFVHPSRGAQETGKNCINTRDDDGDGVPNDGCPLILEYSYNAGSVDPTTGFWLPTPYGCSDTANPLELSILRLGRLIQKFAGANANTRFVIIGHSQGGLIALQALRFVGLPGITIDAVITLDGALGGAPRFDTFIARALSCWGNPAAQEMVRLWMSASDHDEQGTTASFRGVQDNASLVQSAQAKGTRVMTIGNSDDCLWNVNACDWAGQDNSSTQIVLTADVGFFALGGTCLINPVFLPTVVRECLEQTHKRVLDDPRILELIEQIIGSPTIP